MIVRFRKRSRNLRKLEKVVCEQIYYAQVLQKLEFVTWLMTHCTDKNSLKNFLFFFF